METFPEIVQALTGDEADDLADAMMHFRRVRQNTTTKLSELFNVNSLFFKNQVINYNVPNGKL